MGSHSSKRKEYKKHIEFSFGNCLHKLFSLQFIISLAINFMLGQGELSFPTSLPCCLAPVPALATPSPRHFLAPQGLAWRRQITGNTFLHSKLVCPASYPSSSLPTLLNPPRAPLFCPQSSHVLRLSLRFVISVRCVEQLLEINFTFDSCCRRSLAAPSLPPSTPSLSPTLSLHLCLLLLRLHLCTKGTYREWDSHPLPHSFS